MYYNIFNSRFTERFPAYVGQAAVQAGLPADEVVPFVQALAADPTGAAALQVPGVTVAILQAAGLQAQWALVDSLKGVWYASIGVGSVCVIASALLPNIRKYMSNRVAVDLH